MGSTATIAQRIRQSPSLRAFRHRDFRLLWTGSFLSFCGSWIQNVAQGWLVFSLTQDAAKLSLVSFFASAPISILGPFAGAFVDTLDRRKLLIAAQSIYALGALYLSFAIIFHFVVYWHFLVIALFNGCVSTIEIPARQTLVSKVVPPEDLAIAVPLNAMTFNVARLLGPAIGGVLLAAFGAQTCYLINSISFLAPILAVMAMRADLRAEQREPQPIKDLLFEGMRYTFRDIRLRTLFLMESAVSIFALFYVALMPAIVNVTIGLTKQQIEHGADKLWLGITWSSVGVGAVAGLITVAHLADKPIKALLVKVAMTVLGLGLFAVSFSHSPWVALPVFAVVGAAGVMQFNVTNTLFQMLSPERIRGRVIAMHLWALTGLTPIGAIMFGWFAKHYGVAAALELGGLLVLGGAALAWFHRKRLQDVDHLPAS